MNPRNSRFISRAAMLLTLASASSGASAQTITLEVDATDLPRNLAHSTMKIQAAPGPLDLFYVIWSPGNHTPSGPIENVVDLRITDCEGAPLRWDRDPTRVERFSIVVPQGCDHVNVSMSYIASQPNNNSRSTDTYGRPTMGVLNWNTVLLYPGGKTNQQITVAASLGLPRQWTYATPLEPREDAPEGERFSALRDMVPEKPVKWASFRTVTLSELVDSPVIMGQWLSTFELDVPGGAPHSISVVGPEERFTKVPDWLLEKYAEMCRQTITLFAASGRSPFPRERYEFLIAVDETMRLGVEHGTSTLIAMPTRTFIDAKQDPEKLLGGGRDTTVVPHEYFHAWCGKLSSPEGLISSDFSTPARTELLWVYEGLTSYYDNVLAARSGLLSFEEFKQEVLDSAVALEQRTGRLWRSVEDTARAARFLRQRGLYWYDRRRGQEYYGEGAKFWMEADALLRAGSNGATTLDDFCRDFFNVPVKPVGAHHGFNRADVVSALSKLQPAIDWDRLIRQRIEEPVDSLDMNPLLEKLGWRIEFADEPTPEQKKIGAGDEPSSGELNLRSSLGLRLSKEGEVIDIVPGGPADDAGLAYGMKILAVDGWVYASSRLRAAIKETPRTGKIEFVVSFGDRVETKALAYDQGPRVPRLVPIDGAPDLLSAIVSPRE